METKPLDIQRAVRTLQNREPYQLDTLSDYQADVPLLQGITFPKTGVPEIGADGRPVRNPSIIDLDNCPSCQPADPGIGLQTLSGLPGIELPPRLQDATTGGGASAQINQCGAAVQLLRAPVSPTRGNMIDDFDGACLKAGEPETYAQFDADDKREISECLAAHLLYEQNCLQYLDTITDTRIVGRVGMLFNVLDPGEPKPTCTATLISETLIVTARHCYYGEALGNLGPDADATGALAFAPSPVLLAAVKAHLPPYIEVAAEVTPVGERPVAVVTSYPQPPDDVIALRLKTPVPLESPRLKVSWAEVELGSELTLIGFQELAFRRALLEQRIKNAALTAGSSLLEDGAFSAFLRADHGAMCVVGDLTPGQFGHYCQSFQGTSGAPIFLGNLAGSPDPNSTIRLVGFQSRGNANDMPDKEIIGPPNTAARMSAELASLLGLQ
ncbi:trypsin-like serine peptidase [Ensifer sp. LBL]|uniref:trypsin-like serine peptidase n=1 Tax=Ensifer sp. LBL TaxID=2991056 RepID=UPI003D1AE171